MLLVTGDAVGLLRLIRYTSIIAAVMRHVALAWMLSVCSTRESQVTSWVHVDFPQADLRASFPGDIAGPLLKSCIVRQLM